jgi:hypothetical protein
MSSFEKVKNFLLDLGHEISSEEPSDQILVVNNESKGICNMVLDCEDDVLIMEQHMFDLAESSESIYKRLLQMNRGFVHGALVLDETGQKVIFRDTLAIENLDLNELESSFNALAIALAEHADEFLKLAGKN